MGPINWPWLIVGLVIGTNASLFMIALCLAASAPQDKLEELEK